MNFFVCGGFGRLFESVDFGGLRGICWGLFWLEFGLCVRGDFYGVLVNSFSKKVLISSF